MKKITESQRNAFIKDYFRILFGRIGDVTETARSIAGLQEFGLNGDYNKVLEIIQSEDKFVHQIINRNTRFLKNKESENIKEL
jgi:hypothetical protein